MTRPQKALLVVSALCLLATGRFACQRVAERGRFVAAYSSYGSGPLGTRALYLLAERLGARPQRWSQDLAALPKGALLVALSDCESGMARTLSRYEEQELTRWVEEGGVLLVAGARAYVPKGLPVRFEREEGCKEAVEGEGEDEEEHEHEDEHEEEEETGRGTGTEAGTGAESESEHVPLPVPLPDSEPDSEAEPDSEPVSWAIPSAAPLLGLGPLPMRDVGRLVVDDPERAEVILTMPDAPGMPESNVQREVGVVAPHGRGYVIALAAASMLQNRALANADGGVLFARLLARYAPNGPVLFDEYHLGVGERRSMMRYLRQAGAMPLLVQLLFVALLLLWRAGARFGGVRAPEPAVAPDDASFVTALGGLFARTRDRTGARELLVRQALARIARHHHVPPMPARKLAAELDARGRTDAAAALRELGSGGGAGGRDLAAQSRALDALVDRACR